MTTKRSKRSTDRAPHMGRYVRVVKRYGDTGVCIKVDNQQFFIPFEASEYTEWSPKARATWYRDMLCIALDNMVNLEIERRKKGDPKIA